MRKYLKILALSAIAAITMQSCMDSGSDGPTFNVYQNVVTFTGSSDGRSNFLFQELNDSPEVSLYANVSIKGDGAVPGCRMLIGYTLDENRVYGESGPINLRQAALVYESTVATVPADEAKAANAPIPVLTMFRTGKYINLQARLTTAEGRTFRILADESTVDTDMPHLYITTDVPEGVAPGYEVTATASLSIAPIWDKPSVRGVKIHVNNTGNIYHQEFEFLKSN